jgi:hypothetical protein
MLRLYGFEPGIISVEDGTQLIFPSSKRQPQRQHRRSNPL